MLDASLYVGELVMNHIHCCDLIFACHTSVLATYVAESCHLLCERELYSSCDKQSSHNNYLNTQALEHVHEGKLKNRVPY